MKGDKKAARCRKCRYLNWDFITGLREAGPWFCGLHGRSAVDPDGEQLNLNHNGGCGFAPSSKMVQLSLFDESE